MSPRGQTLKRMQESGFARRLFELNLSAGRHIRGRFTDVESETVRVPGG
jgi:hypothetical protein